MHHNFTPAERHQGKFAELPLTRPVTEANTDENHRGRPSWLRDQRNSWNGVDFPDALALDKPAHGNSQ